MGKTPITGKQNKAALKEFSFGPLHANENKNLKWCSAADVHILGEGLNFHLT